MSSAPGCVLTLCSADPSATEDLVRPLALAGWTVDVRPAEQIDLSSNGVQVVLLDEAGDAPRALAVCHGLRGQLGENFIPIVYLGSNGAVRRPGLEAGADLVLPRGIEMADLLAQLQALSRQKERHDQLKARAAEVNRINKSLQDAYQQINHELELARRILKSQRGIGGGISLARTPKELTILEVVSAVDPIHRIRTCPLGLPTHGTNLCPLHKRVDAAMESVEEAFGKTTLQEILDEPSTSIPLCDFPSRSS